MWGDEEIIPSPGALVKPRPAFWSAVACTVGLVDRSGDAIPWIARQWVRWILWSCGVCIEVSGLEQVDLRRSFDIVAIAAGYDPGLQELS